ncbi:L-serine ammonia-lyase, iron-sulfur-dependent subunit beta [Alkalicoccus urumqiensis]|uniref:L-serine deaminase n=1 Tax=Alkalicoccus urumqiensis TaxID=1548213 RepID=A0A2P6MGG9_ALKUR|nr:L-serine ammonia-lyase, iron-sulfur-dependent subunit beta [Alkalicoccus urumqiensis]PRO65330.1 L-serine ammonia-lyase, iron-sulfur-dependent, subunit beta [Alkalicoccus urumqiensis]
MKYRSVFDIIGPVMIGPSSSHTAGAARIGLVARQMFRRSPSRAVFHLYGSFAKTYRGHGTDAALLGGVLGFDTSDERIRTSRQEADKEGLQYEFIEEDEVSLHPNTVMIELSEGEETMTLEGISIGGGKVDITKWNGFDLHLSGNHPALLIVHEDRYGAVAAVADILADAEVNIGQMQVSRKEKGKEALMVIEVDQNVSAGLIQKMEQVPQCRQVTKIHE